MKRELIIGIVGTFILSVSVVIILIGMSDMFKDKHNSFLRLFPSHPVLERSTLDLKVNSYYIAGGTNQHIYLANYSSPLSLLIVNKDLSDTTRVELSVEGIMDQKFWSVRTKVDSPYFYLADGAVPRIYKGKIKDWHAERFLYDKEYFLDWVPMGRDLFAINSLDGRSGERTMGRITLDSPHYEFRSSLLQKQVDGIFCTDGMMQFDRKLNRLIYLYRYRNQYLVMDTSLRLAYQGNTLDTISKAQIKVATIASSGDKTMAAPPLIVNKTSAVGGRWLLVNSNLLAKNEHPAALDEADVIDVYDLLTTRYRFSFYIYHYNRIEKLRDFAICGNTLVVLFDTHIQVFDMRDQYFAFNVLHADQP